MFDSNKNLSIGVLTQISEQTTKKVIFLRFVE